FFISSILCRRCFAGMQTGSLKVLSVIINFQEKRYFQFSRSATRPGVSRVTAILWPLGHFSIAFFVNFEL
ncbi:MAG: hypothetical protein ACLFOZ_20705, partial [Cyclobacteriaceae bacterium]